MYGFYLFTRILLINRLMKFFNIEELNKGELDSIPYPTLSKRNCPRCSFKSKAFLYVQSLQSYSHKIRKYQTILVIIIIKQEDKEYTCFYFHERGIKR